MERLQRVMAARGAGSRRAAEALIRAGRVSVDGEVVTQLGTRVDPQRAEIRVDGRLLRAQRPRYIILNKPRGYITTTRDERNRLTVMNLVKVRERVYPVGRLDRDTEGILLLTNDGDVANRVMHPRYELDKEYHVLTLTRPSPQTLQRVRDGITVDGHRVVPEEFRILRETPEGLLLRIVIHEGIHHVVHRMMEAVGIVVARLRRVRIGPLTATGVAAGTWRDLTPGELLQLFQALGLGEHQEPRQPAPPRGRRGMHRKRRPPDGAPAPSRSSGDGPRPPARPAPRSGPKPPRSRREERLDSPRRAPNRDKPPQRTRAPKDEQSDDDARRKRKPAERAARPERPPPRDRDRRTGGGREDDRRPRPRRPRRRDAL